MAARPDARCRSGDPPAIEEVLIASAIFEAAATLIDDNRRGEVEFWLGGKPPVQVLDARLNETPAVSATAAREGREAALNIPVYSTRLPKDDPSTPEDVQEIADQILRRPPRDASRVLRHQNHELSSCLRGMRERDAARLYPLLRDSRAHSAN